MAVNLTGVLAERARAGSEGQPAVLVYCGCFDAIPSIDWSLPGAKTKAVLYGIMDIVTEKDQPSAYQKIGLFWCR